MAIFEQVSMDSVSLKDLEASLDLSRAKKGREEIEMLTDRDYLIHLPELSPRGDMVARRIENWYDFHSVNGKLSKKQFLRSVVTFISGKWIAERLYTVIHKRARNSDCYRETFLSNLILYFTEAPEDERFIKAHYELCFEVFDVDGDGIISYDDMYGVVSNLAKCPRFSSSVAGMKQTEEIEESNIHSRMRALGFAVTQQGTKVSQEYFVNLGICMTKNRIRKGQKLNFLKKLYKMPKLHYGEQFFFAWSYNAAVVATIIHHFGLVYCDKKVKQKES